MKYRFPLLLIMALCSWAGFLPAQPLIDMTLLNNPANSNKLEIRLRPTQMVTSGAYSAGIFTVRFPVALSGSLSVFSSPYNYSFAGPSGTDGTYNYYRFQFVQNFVVNWTANQEYVAAILEYSDGPATGAFELVTGVTWTNNNNGNFYQELNGLEAQGVFYQQVSTISGNIEWYNGSPTGSGVKDATVSLSGAATGSDDTDANGDYSIGYSTGGNISITPVKNINKLNGITVADAVAIQQHIAGIAAITDPYRQVAADVNKSNSITTFDATIINQLLLGNNSANSQFKTSWRFVPQSYSLSLPPWGFPEKIDLIGASGDQTGQDFYGIKTGDLVTSYANPANLNQIPALVLWVRDQVLEAGTEVTVEFNADQFADLAAWQFALQFDPIRLQLLEIQPGTALPLSADYFGLFNLADGEIRAVWSQANGVPLAEAAAVFSIKFVVLQSGGLLSEVLHLNDAVLPAYAYTSALAETGIALEFVQLTNAVPGIDQSPYQLMQNTPNPVWGHTRIGFVLPGACDATLRVFDAGGRLLCEHTGFFPDGNNAFDLDLGGITAEGMLIYELATPYGVLAKKMMAAGK